VKGEIKLFIDLWAELDIRWKHPKTCNNHLLRVNSCTQSLNSPLQ
jgi:hypothetical protein